MRVRVSPNPHPHPHPNPNPNPTPNLLRGEVGGERVAAAVEREGEHAALGVVAQLEAVGEAGAAQLHPEVALELVRVRARG